MTYTLILDNPGPDLSGVRLTDTLPSEVHYLGDLWASAGSYGASGGSGPTVLTWTGAVKGGQPVTITYGVTVGLDVSSATTVRNEAFLADGQGRVWTLEATAFVGGQAAYLPLIQKAWAPGGRP